VWRRARTCRGAGRASRPARRQRRAAQLDDAELAAAGAGGCQLSVIELRSTSLTASGPRGAPGTPAGTRAPPHTRVLLSHTETGGERA